MPVSVLRRSIWAKRTRSLAILVGVLAILPLAPTLESAGLHPTPSPTHSGLGDGRASHVPRLSAALDSLGRGEGPAHGQGWACAEAAATSATCQGIDTARTLVGVGGWWNLTSRVGSAPMPRYLAAVSDDPLDGYVLLFGGANGSAAGGLLGDTWRYSGGAWNQLSPGSSPSPRSLGGMAFDAAAGFVLLFGGRDASGFVGDTWKFSAGSWNQLFPAASPGRRAVFNLAYDSTDRAVLLHGGANATGLLNDTWKFAGSSWTEVFPVTIPPARSFSSMGYDETDGYVVLFGGLNRSNVALGDTWRFSGNTWSPIMFSAPPSARASSQLAWDRGDGFLLLQGGTTSSVSFTDSWEFIGGAWLPLAPIPSPGPLLSGACSWDSSDGYVLEFSGVTQDSFNPPSHPITWAYASPLVSHPTVNRSPLDIGVSATFRANVTGGIGPDSFNWDFGDGARGSAANPAHSYISSGPVTVNVAVTDSVGELARGQVQVSINPVLQVSIAPVPSSTSTGTSVTFSATVTGGQAPYTYAWGFGDGFSGVGGRPSHAYRTAGSYDVNVSVTDAYGQRSTTSLLVKILPGAASSGVTSNLLLILYGGIAAGTVAVLVGMLLWRRRRRSSSLPPKRLGPAAATPPAPVPTGQRPPIEIGGR
jgi:hypothetical protein